MMPADITVPTNVAEPYDPLSALSRRSMMLQMPSDPPKTFFEAIKEFKQRGPEKFMLPTLLPVTLGKPIPLFLPRQYGSLFRSDCHCLVVTA